MKKKLLLSFFILILPLMVFAGDISATATGSNKDEAEQNAYIELSKFINISVFDEETLEEYSDNNSENQTKYSSQAVHTTANNFIKTEKKFEIDGGVVTCTVTLLESSAPNYIALMSDYVTTINSLENSYDKGKSELPFEIKKATIINLIEEYRKYDNAKSILLALDSFNIDIVKPNKTSAIWNNEYQNIIIQHNNELFKQMSELDSTSTNIVIQNQIDSINSQIAQSKYELQQAVIEKRNSTNQLIEQRQKEIDSTIDNIIFGIIKDNAISAESLTQSIDIKKLLANFSNYYEQYQLVGNQYSLMIKDQKDFNLQEVAEGVKEIEDREYTFSDLNSVGNPGYVARKIRANEVETFRTTKSEEFENNLIIINKKFTPMLNELQASMISILATIDSKEEFTLILNPTEIDCELDVDDGCFYCTIAGDEGYLPIDGVKIKVPLSSLDEKMNFNINDRHFDVNDKAQLKAYNDYTETVDLYKNLMKENQFLSYKFKLKIKASTVLNRFSSGNKYNAKIVTEITDLEIIRNDFIDNVIEGASAVHGGDSRITKQYEDFFNDDIDFMENYYSPQALAFYNTKLGKKTYRGSSSATQSTSNSIESKYVNTRDISNSGFNELGDPYNTNGFSSIDEYKVFLTLGLGGLTLSEDKAAKLSSYYEVQSWLNELNLLSQGSLNLAYFNPAKSSLYFNLSYVYRNFNYKPIGDAFSKTYSLGGFGSKVGANFVLTGFNNLYVSVIPFVGALFNIHEVAVSAGAMLAVDSPSIGIVSLGVDATLTGDLAGSTLFYFEIGF